MGPIDPYLRARPPTAPSRPVALPVPPPLPLYPRPRPRLLAVRRQPVRRVEVRQQRKVLLHVGGKD